MTEVERTIEYQPRNAHVEAIQCNRIKHTPINGSTFTKNSNYIEFRLNPDGTFIDAPRTRLNLVFSAKSDVAGSGVHGVYTSPSIWSVFTSFEVRQGGNILERSQDQNRMYSALSKIYSSTIQNETIGSITDLINPPNAAIPNQCAVGVKISTGDDATTPAFRKRTISVPITLSNLFGPSARKAYPNALLREPTTIRLYLTPNVEEVLYAMAVGATPTYNSAATYVLTDVSLEMVHIRYGQDVMARIRDNMNDSEVTWDGVQSISSINSMSYASTARCILPNTSYSDVRNVIINQFYPVLASNQITMGCSPLNGTYQSQLFLDGNPIARNRPIGAQYANNPIASVPELAQSILDLNRPFCVVDDTNTQLGLSRGNKTASKLAYTNCNTKGATSRPYEIPDTAIPKIDKFPLTADTPVPPYFGLVGFNLVRNGDPSRASIGHDCRGRQLVYEARQTNTITDTNLCMVQAIMCVGVKYVLDTRSGIIRTIY